MFLFFLFFVVQGSRVDTDGLFRGAFFTPPTPDGADLRAALLASAVLIPGNGPIVPILGGF